MAENEMPEFMVEASKPYLAERMREDPEFFVNLARYAANNITESEQHLLLVAALEMRQIRTDGCKPHGRSFDPILINAWKCKLNIYPDQPLMNDDLNRTLNGEMPFRALCILEAVCKLLEIIDAPDAMKRDLQLFMAYKLPKVAERRADVQQALIDHPYWSDTKIAKHIGYDLTRLRKELKSGQLRRMPIISDNHGEE